MFWGRVFQTRYEIVVAINSPFIGKTLNSIGFRERFESNVLAIRRIEKIRRTNLQDVPLQPADVLLVAGSQERLEEFKNISGFAHLHFCDSLSRGNAGLWTGNEGSRGIAFLFLFGYT